ncbi:MAG: hypothetical protein U0792_01740 [Gemmataceae bacterium]
MIPARFIPPPPRDVKTVVGEGYEFLPSHDRLNAGKPIPPAVDLVTEPAKSEPPQTERTTSPDANENP